MEVRLSTTVAETTVRVPTAGQTGFIQPTNADNPQMNNKKNATETAREFPNIYGRKPSAVVKRKDGEFVKGFDSRRQAIFWRRHNTGNPSEYGVVPNGKQEA